MKKLNIKSMAKDMNFKDRAKLIFADCIRRGETGWKESVLQSGEEEALVAACREEGRVSELNRLVALYNMANLGRADVQLSMTKLQLVIARIETYLCVYLSGHEKNRERTIFAELEKGGFVPNNVLQDVFVRVFNLSKYVDRSCFTIEYIFELADMILLGDGDLEIIKEAKEVLQEVLDLEGLIGAMRIFAGMVQCGATERKDYTNKELYDLLNGKVEVAKLNDEEKESAKRKVGRFLADRGHPIT